MPFQIQPVKEFLVRPALPAGISRMSELAYNISWSWNHSIRSIFRRLDPVLWKNSGLKGMSGLSQDMRELEASDSPAARDAIAYFVSRIRRELAGLAAAVSGAEAIVFTAGIGEHSWKVREAALKDMEWMGVHLDAETNRANAQIISAKNSPTIVFVIPTNEELMIAEHTVRTAGVGKP